MRAPRLGEAGTARSGRALALAGFALAAAGARAEVALRIAPIVRSGGQWSSDLFLGAGEGPGPALVVAPSFDADLSLLPRLKLRGAYDLGYAYSAVNAGSAYDQLGVAAIRVRAAGRLWLELEGRASADVYTDVGMPADEFVVGRRLSQYDTLAIAPRLRYRTDALDAELVYTYLSARSIEQIDTIDGSPTLPELIELAHRGALSIGFARGARLATAIDYRVTSNWSFDPGLRYASHELAVVVTASPWSGGWVRAEGGFQRTDFVLGRQDTLWRGTAGLLQTLRDGVMLELSYGYVDNFSTDPNPRLSAGRHVAYLGVRAEVHPWRL